MQTTFSSKQININTELENIFSQGEVNKIEEKKKKKKKKKIKF